MNTAKTALKSIFEGEICGASDGIDSSIYIRQAAAAELCYPTKDSRKVFVDNTATIDWHLEVRIYRARHLVHQREVVLEHVHTQENIADILTKSLPRKQYEHLAKKMLGHDLVKFQLRFWEVTPKLVHESDL